MSRTPSPLTPILALDDADEFLEALAEPALRRYNADGDAHPAPLRMIAELKILVECLRRSGVADFLDRNYGDKFDDTLAWCRLIGAHRTVTYLEATARAFPRGRVPKGRARRSAAVRWASDAVLPPTPDVFCALDAQYVDAPDEVAECLRAHARKQRRTLTALIRAAETAPEPPGWETYAERAIATLEQRAAEMKDDAAALRLLADQRADRSPRDGSEDPRMAGFMDALHPLSETDWLAVVRRAGAS